MADALTRQAAWLFTRLHGDAPLVAMLATDADHSGVYLDVITPPAQYPAVVFSNLSLRDINALGPHRCGTNALWLVKGIDRAERGLAALQPILDAVDALIQTGHAESGAITVVTSEDTVSYAERDEAGVAYRHLGRRYRMLGPAA